MAQRPKISVIVPIYNVEKYLAKCLDSIIGQTLKEIEIICVNDGSTDNSTQILKEYATRDNRIKVIQQKNGGLSAARNTGLKHASTELIAFMDSDDI
ncbi:MAG: glycosyltransferase, partial [Rickettsiales bacterium]|nr:glycosyltransferase [Rickettsiales bacterium]